MTGGRLYKGLQGQIQNFLERGKNILRKGSGATAPDAIGVCVVKTQKSFIMQDFEHSFGSMHSLLGCHGNLFIVMQTH